MTSSDFLNELSIVLSADLCYTESKKNSEHRYINISMSKFSTEFKTFLLENVKQIKFDVLNEDGTKCTYYSIFGFINSFNCLTFANYESRRIAIKLVPNSLTID